MIVDTDVCSRVFVKSGDRDVGKQALRDVLAGRTVAISLHTRAELLIWPRWRNWSENRASALRRLLVGIPTIPVTDAVVEAFVELTVACRKGGHALAAKTHVTDRWIAATAIAIDRPLVAVDRIYEGAPGVALIRAGSAVAGP
ncbi:MAG: PIN domain-containing protein [Pseudonocardia sp.]|nr:PIN domain-containing protein [Pseudonocardia sp.]